MAGADKEENWISTDETDDVAGSVRHALRCLALTNEDRQAWKWAALSLHSALQGACICHLVTTCSPVGAVTEKNAGEILKYIEASRTNPNAKRPKTRLMDLAELLKAIRRPNSAGDHSGSSEISMTDSELTWLLRFHRDIRNQYTHFEPMGWSIEVSGIPAIAGLIARVIQDIESKAWAFRHRDRTWLKSLRNDLALLSAIAQKAAF